MAILIPRVMEEPTWATCVINLRPGVTTSFLTSRSDHRHSRHCHHTISGIRHIIACHHYRFLYSSTFLWSAVMDIFQTRLMQNCVLISIHIVWVGSGLHKLWYPGIRDRSTWSMFGAHGEHGDVFLFSNLGAL